MRKKLLSILALLCLTASSAWAGVIESGTNGNITWSLDDDGVLSISGSGEVPEGLFPYEWSNGTKAEAIAADIVRASLAVRSHSAFFTAMVAGHVRHRASRLAVNLDALRAHPIHVDAFFEIGRTGLYRRAGA